MVNNSEQPQQQQEQQGGTRLDEVKAVSILAYDSNEHSMKCGLHVRHHDAQKLLVDDALQPLEERWEWLIDPSDEWMEDYREWKRQICDEDYDGVNGCKMPPPVFDSISSLRSFNAKGKELTERLKVEVENNSSEIRVIVEQFKPIYSNVAIGDVVCSWWNVKDMNYNFVIPIQKLPISDDLKSQLQVWRFHKLRGWDDPEIRKDLYMEAHELEASLLLELNDTTIDKDAEKDTDPDPQDISPTCAASRTPNTKLKKSKNKMNAVDRMPTPCLT